jgi:hypothetical protein
VVIRARHDRKLAEGGVLFEAADAWPDLGKSKTVVPPRGPGDKPRTAQVAIRASRVRLAKPAAKVRTPDPEVLDIGSWSRCASFPRRKASSRCTGDT